ncbi:MAG: hypothetical protein JOY51_05595, partial [Nevskia sp.]|nr:hypothetical protein [Nevskia sp.]
MAAIDNLQLSSSTLPSGFVGPRLPARPRQEPPARSTLDQGDQLHISSAAPKPANDKPAEDLPGSQYDLPPPSNKDKWDTDFRKQALHYGQKGWARYGDLIKQVAHKKKIDPFILGAYVWNESNFDPNQDYSKGGM